MKTNVRFSYHIILSTNEHETQIACVYCNIRIMLKYRTLMPNNIRSLSIKCRINEMRWIMYFYSYL